MMILLVAATEAEISPFLSYLRQNWVTKDQKSFTKNDKRIDVLVTGVGMLSTTYTLTKHLLSTSHKYNLILQAGIGGSYDRSFTLDSLVQIESERIGDLGAEDHYQFHDVFDLGLSNPNAFPFEDGKLTNPVQGLATEINLPKVTSLTVNSTTGSSFTADSRWEKYGCTMESMEGAALHYVCLSENLPFAQVRAVSNYVEARNRAAWNIGGAIKALNEWLKEFLD